VHVGKARVLRLMRVHGLLAPTLPGHPRGDPARPGRITTDHPDEIWGTDAMCFWTARDGWCWFFRAIDHATDELMGWKATKRGTARSGQSSHGASSFRDRGEIDEGEATTSMPKGNRDGRPAHTRGRRVLLLLRRPRGAREVTCCL
jgi:hypothetical protein